MGPCLRENSYMIIDTISPGRPELRGMLRHLTGTEVPSEVLTPRAPEAQREEFSPDYSRYLEVGEQPLF